MNSFRSRAVSSFGFLVSLGVFGVASGCSSEGVTTESGETSTGEGGNGASEEEATSRGVETIVSRFVGKFDPLAEEPVSFTALPSSVGDVGKFTVSVVNDVTITGAGTWDAGTERLTAPVVITQNNPGLGDMDEVSLVITSVTGPGAAVAVWETKDGGSSTGPGTIAFADIQASTSGAVCSSGVVTSAGHALSVHVPGGAQFDFTFDIQANLGGGTIRPDCDGDRYNDEAGQLAGDDCNDSDPAASPVGNACSCGSSCTSPDVTCDRTISSGSFTCPVGGCACDIDASSGTDVSALCGSDCSVDCTGAGDGADSDAFSCRNNCRSGSECDQTCTNGSAGICYQDCNTDATVKTCDLDCTANTGGSCRQDCAQGSTCSADCSHNPGGLCDQNCSGASTCELTCSSTGGDCDTNCSAGSQCTLACDDASGACAHSKCTGTGTQCDASCVGTGSDCGVTVCSGGANCSVSCGAGGEGAPTSCGIDSCDGSATTCNVTCVETSSSCFVSCRGNVLSGNCLLDCSAIAPAERAAKCQVDCPGPRVPQEIGAGTGVYGCF